MPHGYSKSDMKIKSRMGKSAIGALLGSLLPLAVMAYQGPGLYRAAINGTLSLYQTVEVDKGARIHIQDGEVKRFQNINHIEPYCYFYSSRSGRELDNPFIVHSADFLITHVQQRRKHSRPTTTVPHHHQLLLAVHGRRRQKSTKNA